MNLFCLYLNDHRWSSKWQLRCFVFDHNEKDVHFTRMHCAHQGKATKENLPRKHLGT